MAVDPRDIDPINPVIPEAPSTEPVEELPQDADPISLRKANEERIQVLLIEYNAGQPPSVLAELVELNMDYVRAIVAQVTNPVQHLVDFEDLVQYGVMGLLSAIRLYKIDEDPLKRKTRFSTYAFPRIRGSVQDAVRRMSSTSRTRNVHFQPLEDKHTENLADPSWDEFVKGFLPSSVSEALRTSLRELPIRQSIILLLSANGLPLSMIERMLEVSYTRVLQEKQAALASLRVSLEEKIGHQREAWEG